MHRSKSWRVKAAQFRELKTLEELWPKLHQKFAGTAWDGAWKDWQERFDALQAKVQKTRKK